MIATKNTEILEKVLVTIHDITSRTTSGHYAQIILDTQVKKLEASYPFLKHVTVKTISFSTSAKTINIDAAIDKEYPKNVEKAIQDLVLSISKMLGSEKKYFISEFKGYMGRDYEVKLQNMGVKL